ncbi:hypothetical protein U1Q18_038150 [Sarracenia purpurea var. burkii]
MRVGARGSQQAAESRDVGGDCNVNGVITGNQDVAKWRKSGSGAYRLEEKFTWKTRGYGEVDLASKMKARSTTEKDDGGEGRP